MKNLILILWAMAVFCTGCSIPGLLSPEKFTQEYVEAIQQAYPGTKVAVEKELDLKIVFSDGRELKSFLENTYVAYRHNPELKEDLKQRYLAALEGIHSEKKEIDRTRIVPVVKDRPWLDEAVRRTLLRQGVKNIPKYIVDDLNPDLVVLYAEDSPTAIRYLIEDNLAEAKIARSELRALACANLRRLIEPPKLHGKDGFYTISAGGNYEASLLLLEKIWDHRQIAVKGDFVVSIPTRDLLLVTGSQDPAGLEQMKQVVEKAASLDAYRLTTKFFVYRNGKLEKFSK